MKNSTKKKILIISLLGFFAVLVGAFGAHYLKERISTQSLHSFQTGVNYHFFHTLAAFMTLLLSLKFKETQFSLSFWLFVSGILLFSGSIYLLATKSIHNLGIENILGPLTPLGGVLFMLAWLSLFWNVYRLKKSIESQLKDETY